MDYFCLVCGLVLSTKYVVGEELPKIDNKIGYSIQWHKVGLKLTLDCKADYPITWQYPDNSIYEGFTTGRMSRNVEKSDGTYYSQLKIDYLTHADTGKYTCHKRSDSRIQSNVYIFSNGERPEELFMHYKDEYKPSLTLYLEKQSRVPCFTTYEPKPTGDADVSLWINNTQFSQKGVQYNFKDEKGFEISPEVLSGKFHAGDTVTVECKADVNYMQGSISFEATFAANSNGAATKNLFKRGKTLSRAEIIVIGAVVGVVLLSIIIFALTVLTLKIRHRLLLKQVQRHRDPDPRTSILSSAFLTRRWSSISYDPESAPSTRGYTPVVDPNSLKYDRRYELSKDWLWYDPTLAPLGKGRFGKVVCGTLHLPLSDAEKYPALARPRKVAIKLPNDGRDPAQQKALLDELKIMGNLGHHPNVLGLIGAVTEHMVDGVLFMIMELCESGCLLFYLRKYRSRFIDQTKYLETQSDEEDGYLAPRGKSISRVSFQEFGVEDPLANSSYLPDPEFLSTSDLVAFSYQVANGMSYLSHRLIHRDLAARNLLLTDRRILKIADFGLAKPDYTYHRSISSDTPLPVKWLAIESLVDREHTVKSDVWSFGIVMFEIFSLGESPYLAPEFQQDLIGCLRAGKRMERPKYALNSMYQLMQNCWLHDPDDRPTFQWLKDSLAVQLQKCSKTLYDSLRTILAEEVQVCTEYLNWRHEKNGKFQFPPTKDANKKYKKQVESIAYKKKQSTVHYSELYGTASIQLSEDSASSSALISRTRSGSKEQAYKPPNSPITYTDIAEKSQTPNINELTLMSAYADTKCPEISAVCNEGYGKMEIIGENSEITNKLSLISAYSDGEPTSPPVPKVSAYKQDENIVQGIVKQSGLRPECSEQGSDVNSKNECRKSSGLQFTRSVSVI